MASSGRGGRDGERLKGNLALTGVHEVLQVLSTQKRTGELDVTKMPEEITATLTHRGGNLILVRLGERRGIEVLNEVLRWRSGVFEFRDRAAMGFTQDPASPSSSPAKKGIQPHPEGDTQEERSENMERDTTSILADLVKVPGIQTVVVVGRDGFAIETAGSSGTIDVDALGASMAHAINAIEEMGGELSVDLFQDLFIEYRHATILCRPVGDAMVTLVTPDASKLGIVRHKIKPLVAELAAFF